MQYNESQYNGDSYNLTNYTSTLVETVTPTDGTLTFSVGSLRTDSQGTADAVGGSASLQAFLDSVTIYQRAHTPFAYNNGRYNDFMYNARADEDEILLMATKSMLEGILLADVMAPFTIDKVMTELMTVVDSTVFFSGSTELVEVIVVDELFTIQVTNKALNATVRVNDWLSIEQNPQSDNWGDQ